MKIAAITDIHGRIRNLKKAIDLINADSQLDYVINCGDVGGADTLEYLRKIRLPHYLSDLTIFLPAKLISAPQASSQNAKN